jgi:hypothetical protein
MELMRSFYALVIVLPIVGVAAWYFVGHRASGPDLSMLPRGSAAWCCESETCFAARPAMGFSVCLNPWWYGAKAYNLDEGHKIDGQWESCADTLRQALAKDPNALDRRHGDRPYIDSCLPDTKLEQRDYAYVVTYFDRPTERYEWYAKTSQYYCDRLRNMLMQDDTSSGVSSCERVLAGSN